jgi:hypothetical protein
MHDKDGGDPEAVVQRPEIIANPMRPAAKVDNPSERESEFLRERAATLRDMAAEMPPSVARQLLDIAAQLEMRAAKLEGSQTFESGEGV